MQSFLRNIKINPGVVQASECDVGRSGVEIKLKQLIVEVFKVVKMKERPFRTEN